MIDTQEKRRMAIDFGKIRGTGMPNPPLGLSSVPARAHILNLYFEMAPVAVSFFWRNRNFVQGLWSSKTTPATSWTSKISPQSGWKPKVTPPDGSTQVIE